MLNPSGKPPAADYDQLEGQVVAAKLTQKSLQKTRGDSLGNSHLYPIAVLDFVQIDKE